MDHTRNDLCLINIARKTVVALNTQDQTSATAAKTLPFRFRLQTGGYITIEHQGRKASIFPFELFAVRAERFYFGPVPSRLQPIYPEAIQIHEDAQTAKATGSEESAPVFDILGLLGGSYRLLVSLGAFAASALWKTWSHMEFKWVLLKALVLGTALTPLRAEAPACDPIMTLNTLDAARSHRFLVEEAARAPAREKLIGQARESENRVMTPKAYRNAQPLPARTRAQLKREPLHCWNRVTLLRNATAAHHLQIHAPCTHPPANQHEQKESLQ